ncbi:MAG: right-handed parallel beta-helix repeat-containing protein [Thermoplasmata archaeon]
MKLPVYTRILTLFALISIVSSLFLPMLSTHASDTNQNLVVAEGDTLVIRDETLLVEGDIDVRGTLILNNVDMILNTSSPGSYVVQNGGVLDVKDSFIISYEDNTEGSISLELEPGYHLLSFPFLRTDDSISSVLSPIEGHYDRVLYYDAWNESSPWKSYQVDRPEHFNSLNEINRTMGVLVNIVQETVLEFQGLLPQHIEIPLNEGLNMVGYPLHEPMSVSEAFQDIIDDLKKVEEDTPQGSRELELHDELIPGHGYNIYMHNRASWTIEAPYETDPDYPPGFDFEFMEGSMVSIDNSEIYGSRNPEARPEFVVRSNQVSFKETSFMGGSVNIFAESSSPSIRDCSFRYYRSTAVHSENSTPTLRNNLFHSDMGWAVQAQGEPPAIVNNQFKGYRGIRFISLEAPLVGNSFDHISDTGISLEGGLYTIEDNVFKDTAVGIKAEDSEVCIRHNHFYSSGNCILLQHTHGEISDNDMEDSIGWTVHISRAEGVNLERNKIYNGSNGIRISGGDVNITHNTIENNTGTGILSNSGENLLVDKNQIIDNGGNGLYLEQSSGAVLNNVISRNEGGLWTDSPLWIANNTFSENKVYGVSAISSSPYIENNIFNNNSLYGIKLEGSSSIISSTGIVGGHYHLHLTDSQITVVNSFLDEAKIYMDTVSNLDVLSVLNLTMEEDTRYTDFDLKGLLPPGSEILGVTNNDPITVDIHDDGVDFLPPENFHDTVDMMFEIRIIGNVTSWFSFTLKVTPVNDPPVITEVSVHVTDLDVYWLLDYEDVDGNRPTYVEIVINGDKYPMESLDPDYDGYAQGVLFFFEKTMTPGTYSYYYVAQEYNPLGENITVTSEEKVLEVEDHSPNVLGFIGEGILFIVVVILSILIAHKLISAHEESKNDKLNIHGEGWIEDFSEEDCVGDFEMRKGKNDQFKGLPVLKKKDRRDLPVLKKREKRKRKLRAVVEEGENEEEEEPIIDVVGEVDTDNMREETVEIPPAGVKKQRKVKPKKKRWTVKKKYRAIKEDGSGKKKRILRD